MMHLLTANGLTPGGSSTAHIYTQATHRKTHTKKEYTEHNVHNKKNT